MHERLRRILMNSLPSDGAPSGAPPSGGALPAPAPAQGASNSTEPSHAEQLKSLLGPMFKEFKDGIFADLRRTGAIKGKQAEALSASTEQPANGQQTAQPAQDVQTIIARERQFSRAISGMTLSEAQFARMERAYQLEQPEDPAAWAKGWAADMGIGKPAEAGGQQPPNPAPHRTGPPVSDGGGLAPPPAATATEEPWRYSRDDVARNIRQKGMAAAGLEYKQQLKNALAGRRIRLK